MMLVLLALLLVSGTSSGTYIQGLPPAKGEGVEDPHHWYSVTLTNSCPVTIFAAAFGPSAVYPDDGDWILNTGESITITLPKDWLSTQSGWRPGHHHRTANGPRFWARTGCLHDVSLGKAQCETGDCGNRYDCSDAMLAGRAPVSIAEFCFDCGDDYTYYDISLVDGPGDPLNPFWCKSNLCTHGQDLRASCPKNYTLISTDLPFTSGEPRKVACFSNCGFFEYPTAPNLMCLDTDPQCVGWRKYCCQATTYGKPCKTSDDCTDGGACWAGVCACKAYYSHPPCGGDTCTFPDAQPEPGKCTNCSGDDACPRAYTWPNDYNIIFCPGGSNVTISPPSTFTACSALSTKIYNWTKAQTDCSEAHGKYLCAVPIGSKPSDNWACDVDNQACDGMTCSWA